MLQGLALTPPVIGRIAIGKVVERAGRHLPEKDDEFTITSQVQNKDGWILHPLDAWLRRDIHGKLRSIPVRLLFNDPDLSLRASYSMFDRSTGRPLCVGDGNTCKRQTLHGMQAFACPAPEGCSIAREGMCKPYARMHVRIDVHDAESDSNSEPQEMAGDELACFILRTTGFNTIRTLATRLRYFHAVSGGLLASLPLELRLRGKSTTLSHRAPIYFVDLTVRHGLSMAQALEQARIRSRKLQESGFDQEALDAAARSGLAFGAFEESEEEGASVVEEFYPDAETGREAMPDQVDQARPDSGIGSASRTVTLRGKLARRFQGARVDGDGNLSKDPAATEGGAAPMET